MTTISTHSGTRHNLGTSRARRRCAAAVLALTTALPVAAGCQEAVEPTTVRPGPTAFTASSSPGPTGDVTLLPGNASANAMILANDGSLWVSERQVGGIAKVDPTGNVTQYKVPEQSDYPNDIVQGPDGTIWFISSSRIGFLDPSGEVMSGRSGYPQGLCVGPDGAIWYTTSSGQAPAIGRADSARMSTVVVLPHGKFTFPDRGIATGPDHAVWFTQIGTQPEPDGIGRVAADGTYTSWPLPSRTSPQNITAGPDGALWFTHKGGIGRITVNGDVSDFPVPQANPSHLISGPEDALWFTTDTRVGRLTPTGNLTLWPVPGAQDLSAIAAIPSGGFWLADRQADVIRRFVPSR
ncbi:hypothetical protein ACIRRH_38990 [Kitasatospora sp. NPDC101235]|uniref:Vgb family protein n=1 Tax=Kitasatospora sp. NPDC101235 TaxID=3364101 RepID=UPI0037F77649